jgi:hypothetical protein
LHDVLADGEHAIDLPRDFHICRDPRLIPIRASTASKVCGEIATIRLRCTVARRGARGCWSRPRFTMRSRYKSSSCTPAVVLLPQSQFESGMRIKFSSGNTANAFSFQTASLFVQ